MRVTQVLWDLEDDVRGNAWHIAPIVDLVEVDEILFSMTSWEASRTSGNSITFGVTSSGVCIAVVFNLIDKSLGIVRPITAFEVDF